MSKYKDLSEEEKRAQILKDYENGESLAVIAGNSGYHVESVRKIINKFTDRKSMKRARGAGRPKSLGPSDKIGIINCVRQKPWLSSTGIKERLHLQAQPRTIRQYLESLHYAYKKPYRKPKLTFQDKINRVDWALNHKNYDFSKVVFADECSIWMKSWQGRMWLKRGSRHYIGTKAYYPKVHVWGSIGFEGQVGIHVFSGNMTAPKFIAILKESLIPQANEIYGKGQWSLAQDNDPKHRARITQDFLKLQKVAVEPWPSYSPDINPIENVWALLKADVTKKGPRSVESLISCIYDSWKNIDKTSIINSSKSIDKRIEGLIDSNGEPLNY